MKIHLMQTDVENHTKTPDESIFNNLIDIEPYEKNLKNARIWLYIIAAIQFGIGLYEYFTIEDNLVAGVAFGIDAFIGLSFLTLSLWSKKKPAVAFTIALIFYLVVIVAFMIIDPANIFKGIILKIFVIIALVKANRDAKKYEEIKASIGKG